MTATPSDSLSSVPVFISSNVASHAPRRIRLIAPSGYPESADTAQRAIARLREAGHTVDNTACIERRFDRFAGTDAERTADLNALADPSVPLPDIALAIRGGYGVGRLLNALDYDGIARRLKGQPVALVGQSDFTALQLALYARTGLVTFGGPMLARNFGQETPSAFTMEHFWGMLQSSEYVVQGHQPDQPVLEAEGTLWGGNLTMLASLVGTPFMPAIEGGILFIEDVHEQPFRVERMLYQLTLAGILQRQKALVMGVFSGHKTTSYDNGYTLDSVIAQIARVAGIPVLTGLQFGHVDDILTLPTGAHARLRSGADGFTLHISGHPTLA
jgi:muramoyltetrapeptide carboxypeptidase